MTPQLSVYRILIVNDMTGVTEYSQDICGNTACVTYPSQYDTGTFPYTIHIQLVSNGALGQPEQIAITTNMGFY